jgi:ABC-type transporter Mla subunit MlaD
MSHGRPRHRQVDTLRLGLIVIAAFVIVAYVGATKSIPLIGSAGGRLLHVELPAARQVTGRTPVRVHGIGVGKVESVQIQDGGRHALVSIRLTDDGVKLHADAGAAVRFRTFLGGQMEIAINPGSPSAPPLASDTIPLSHTRIQTENDDLLQLFDAHGRVGQRRILHELPRALRGSAAGRVLDALGPALRPAPPAWRGLLGRRSDDLRALVGSAARTADAIGRRDRTLEALVEGAQRTFRATAAAQPSLGAVPPAMDATASSAQAIQASLPDLDALVADLQPGARQLASATQVARPALRELDVVLREARPLLRSLRPAVLGLARSAGPGRRLVAALDPSVRRLQDDLIPFLESTDSDLRVPVYQMIGPTFATLNSTASEYDDFGHVEHFPVLPGAGSASALPALNCSQLLAGRPGGNVARRCDGINAALALLLTGRAAR